jgi:toxin ParE1/3/4
MRFLTYKKHLIFFAPLAATDGAPVILRIVHQSRYLPALAYYDDLDSV